LFGADGTLDIPLGETSPDDLTSVEVSLNALDGFGLSSPMTMGLGAAVTAESVTLGESVRVFEVQTTQQGAVTGVVSELGAAQIAVAALADSVAIVPVAPLKESTDYVVIATNGIQGTNGTALAASSSFQLTSGSIELSGEAAALEPVRLLTNSILAAVAAEGVDASTVVQAWSFKTQSITPVMQAVKSASSAAAIAIAPTGLNTSNVVESLPGIADIYIGTIDLPYYRTAPANANDPAGITSFWQTADGGNVTRFNPTPVATSVQTVPVLMTVPNAASGNVVPANGWPVTIFVHGVTSDRSAMIAIADAMAQAGFAMIAIDQPMHGITDATSPLFAANTPFEETERTFDIDLVNNETGAPGPDGLADSSGRHFYSPLYLLATRDNLRQSVADLFVLSDSIANITTVPVDASRKSVIGHSLGGAAVTPFLAFDTTISAATLGMPAAGLVGTTISSESFGPAIIAGLAAAGVEEGTADFEAFKVAAQTVVDSGDAINFGAQAAQNVPIHMIEVIGDTTVKNNVPGSPLVGTDALARVMGLPQTSADTTESAIVKFTAGNHVSLLSPEASLAATLEMQAQTAAFAASNGSLI
ncbi:MAG: lipase, partial [Pseudomonadota bacterium]